MSAISSIPYSSALSTASLPVSTQPATDASFEPAVIRNGNQAAKSAYQEGMAFENILVNELSQQLAATVPGLNGSSSSDDGLGGSSDDSSSDSSSSGGLGAYSSLLPQALSQGLESKGGTGMAMEIARALDPALNSPMAAATTAPSTAAATAAGASGGVAATTTSTGAAQ